jgi:hypothetical protein
MPGEFGDGPSPGGSPYDRFVKHPGPSGLPVVIADEARDNAEGQGSIIASEMKRTITVRDIGILLMVSAPFTALLGFAALSVLVGEDRLEGAGGPTIWGWAAMALPATAGVALFVAGTLRPTSVSDHLLTVITGAAAVVSLTFGLATIVVAGPGDASIGGDLLVLTGVALAGIAVLHRNRTAGF